MKNKFLNVAMLLSASTFLCGCSGGSSSNQVTIGVSNSSAEYKSASAIANAFNDANPDLKVKVVRLGSDYSQSIIQGKLAKNLPDIVFTQDDTAAYFSQEGVFEPLDSYFEKDSIDLSLYYDSILNIARPLADGKTYFLPRDYNKVVCVYNKKMFDAANVEYPTDNWTWADFVDKCNELKTYTDSLGGSSKGYYPAHANFGWKAVYWPMLASYGEELINANKEFAVTSASKTLATMKEMVEQKLTIDPSSGSASEALFGTGNVAMVFTVRPNLTSFVGKPNVDLDFASLPTYSDAENSYIGTGCSGYALNKDSTNKDAAWKFLKFMISEDGQKAFAKTGNGVPLIKSMSNDDSWRKISVNNIDLSNKNHDAFIKFQERDKITNYMGSIEPRLHTKVYNEVDAFVKAVFSDEYKTNLAGCIETYKERIANILKS